MKLKFFQNTIILLIIFLIILLHADPLPPLENFKIILSWSTFGSELEAVLIIPDPESGVGYPLNGSLPGESPNGYVVASGDISSNPEIGTETFTIRKFTPGIYQIWVKNKFIEEGFSDEDIFGSEEDVFSGSNARVDFYLDDQLIKSIAIPSDASGMVWLPAEIEGSTKNITEVNECYSQLRAIHGKVIDAVTGDPLETTLVIIKNRDTKETVGRAISDKTGKFIVSVDPGRYVVYIGKKTYISDKFKVDVMHDFPRSVHAVLTKIIPSQDYRIILTWDRFPVDVDAHLRGPHPDHEDFHIYWNRRSLIKGKNFLDRDDTRSYGPETITIYGLDPGTYRYTVHNYSGRSETSGDALSRGNINVKIYNGDQLLKEYQMPSGTSGSYWRVFEIDGETATIRDINQTGFEKDPDEL